MDWRYIGAAFFLIVGVIIGLTSANNHQMQAVQDRQNGAWACILCVFVAACFVWA